MNAVVIHPLRWLLALCLCVFAVLVQAAPAAAGSTGAGANTKNFNHLRTGFALNGVHAKERCESCHVGGVFKGTPRDCVSCHSSGSRFARSNTVKPTNHLPTTQSCDTCHGTLSFSTGRFNHAGVKAGTCASCHNGNTAPGKSADHLPTTASCDSCHRSVAWVPASGVDHSTFGAATNCASCHNGSTATGKTATHIPTGSAGCFSCHNTNGWKPTKWNHTQTVVAAQCASCHSGAFPPADGKSATHIPYASVSGMASASCDSCHKAGYAAWTPAKLHGSYSVTAQCVTCHLTIRPTTAIHTGVTVCESCHKSTASWTSGSTKVDHSTFGVATNCASCHNGSTATGKTASHIPTGSAGCFSCHNTAGWKPTKWNHTQTVVAAQCASCHSGAFPPADGKPATHIPYASVSGMASANCDSCHKAGYAAWTPAKLHGSYSVTAQCATCHIAIKPTTAIHTGVTVCESCHKSTASWTGGSTKVDHSTFTVATNCASCHNGSTATGKTATHIPTGSAGCLSCHTTTAWKPTKWNHTQTVVAAQCASCHSGSFPPADGKSATHIPYASVSGMASANCDSCHKAGYAAWTPAKFHSSYSVSTQCATCHSGSFAPAVGKPNTAIHVGATVCESCHKSTASWTGGSTKVDHSTFTVATNCASCHNGSTATGKTATHIPTGAANCISCHTTTAWKPTRWNHTQVAVTAQCSSCHSGSYPPADGKPATHIPYLSVAGVGSANCDSCHKAGYAAWTPARFHSSFSVSAQCMTCHSGSFPPAVGKPNTPTHVGVTLCESCHKSTASWTSGITFTHSAANAVGTGTCDACHTGSTALGKPATHIMVPAGVAKCDSCHRSQVSFASATTMNHTVVTTATCKSCHNGSYTSQGTTGALAKPTNHIPEAQLLNGAALDCNACHSGNSNWTTVRMNHNSSMGGGAGWCKGCHASGTSYLGNIDKNSLTHQKKTPAAIDCSESGCHRPLGSKGAAYTKWN